MTTHPDEYASIADLYDHVTLYADRADISFYVDAAVESLGSVLELGCGTGRVLVPTARAGVDIVGLDGSPSMLASCRARVEKELRGVQDRVTLVAADMRRFELGRTFPLITVPFRPFQHLLSVDDQLAALACMRAHLTPNGRVIIDLFNPSFEALTQSASGAVMGPEPPFTVPDGRSVIRKHRIAKQDRFTQVNDVEIIYEVTHPDGRTETFVHSFQMRYLFRYEVEHLLARAGFEVEQLYGGFDKRPFGSTYPGELIFVARKAS